MFLALGTLATASLQVLTDGQTSLVYPPFWHTPLGIHRGTQDLLMLFAGSRARFAEPAGLACTSLLSESPASPRDCRVTVLGANTGQSNLIYNPSMTQLDIVGNHGATRDLFRRPTGVAAYPDGTVYVTDSVNQRVVRLKLAAKKLAPDGELAPPPGGWREPWGVSFDSRKNLYVSDAGLNQIYVYAASGDCLRTFGPELPGGLHLQAPRALAVMDADEPWSYFRDDYLYVADCQGRRLLRLQTQTGVPRLPLQIHADVLPASDTPAAFAWMALDYYENLWVTDPLRCQVHKFNRHLEHLTSYGSPGSGDGRFQQPSGIAIHRHFGQVFVAERQAVHYFWIGTDCLNLTVQPLGSDVMEIRCLLTEPARVNLSVASAGSTQETSLLRTDWVPSGPFVYRWLCPAPLHDKTLVFRFTAEATYSSARHFAKQVTYTLKPEINSTCSR